MRTVKQIIPAQKVNMGGIILDQPLPFGDVDQIDPFLLLHHWKRDMPGGQRQGEVGVGPHPHRGFSPVTFIFKGSLLHQDSRGNRSVVGSGGTQWMNSGMGIIHSERPAKELAEQGGEFEIIQFWVNAPSSNKMDQPSYQPLSEEQTPKYISDDGLVEVGIVAGELYGQRGKISAHSEIIALRLDVKQGAKTDIPVPRSYNAFLYQLDGNLRVNGAESRAKDLVWLENDGDIVQVEGLEPSRAILLAGVPIGEKLATYGPFVMNSQTEIMEALRDYQMGKMGALIEQFD
jgi:redox-sensitive bicupin YhaK (pirin superfamily)